MGYTHYWRRKEVSAETFKSFIKTCKALYKAMPKTSNTAGGYYENEPIIIRDGQGNKSGKHKFTDKQVWFNGDATTGNDHETFSISLVNHSGDYNFRFCKTARKPYDFLVCVCLIAAKKYLGYRISSDGGQEDWQPAIDFWNKHMNDNLTFVDIVSK